MCQITQGRVSQSPETEAHNESVWPILANYITYGLLVKFKMAYTQVN